MAQATTPKRAGRRARGSLSAEEILDATHALITREGLAGLSMPALARELGAGVTSIYWYFRTKDDLLVALAERTTVAFFDRLPPPGADPWPEEWERHFVAFRDELLRVPEEVELFSLRPRAVLNRPLVLAVLADKLEPRLAPLVAVGVPAPVAIRLYAAAWSYTHGAVLLERAYDRDPGEHATVDDVLRASGNRIGPDEVPLLAEVGTLDAVTDVSDRGFRLGLQTLLSGIRAEVARYEGPDGKR